MVLWYLMVVVSGTTPQVTAYATEQEACLGVMSNPGSHIYLVSGHRNKPSIVEGECKAVQSFVTHK